MILKFINAIKSSIYGNGLQYYANTVYTCGKGRCYPIECFGRRCGASVGEVTNSDCMEIVECCLLDGLIKAKYH